MTNSTDDPLSRGLAGLAADPPVGLRDRVVAWWVRVEGPTGALYVASTDRGIAYVRIGAAVQEDAEVFAEQFRTRLGRPLTPAAQPPAELLTALRTGRTDELRFDLRESTDFQRDVLAATRTIPRGQVRPYAWIAQEIGRPKAVRAVGSALRNNPVPLLIPCHRVVLSDDRTGEYVFGPAVKQALLREERAR